MSYVYDAWGNYLQQNQTGGTTYQHQYLADVTNRLSGYSYDPAGNMLADSSHQYAYDAESRIKTVDSTAASYTYNPEGNRVRKDVGANSTEYFYFGGHVIAELDQAGNWTDYIYANGQRIAKADAFFREIDIGGTNSSNTQYSIFHFPNPGTLIGYTIRPGDKFYFWQYEWPGTEAGMRITFTDASSTNWIAVDQYGNYMNAGIAAGGTRIVDLSGFAGKQVSALDITSAVGTAAGNWASSFHDIALVSADGTVISIYNGEATDPTVFDQTNGATGQTTVVSNSPGRYDPNFSTMYYHDDQLGTSRMMTSHSGYPIWQGTFLPYGEEYNPQMTMNHFKFTGKERDSESQLDYFGARFYSDGLGRFTGVDPKRIALRHLLNPQKLNKYSYVVNNPIGSIDPDGMEDIKVFVHFNAGDTMPKNQPNWGAIQQSAAAHGNTVTVFQGDAANSKNFQSSVSSGGTTVFIGHSQSVDNGQGMKTVAVSLSDKEIGQPSNSPDLMGAGRDGPDPNVLGSITNPGVLPDVSSSSNVALFGCATDQLSGQYSNAASFVGVDSGPDHATSADGLLSAGGAYVADLAAGKSTSSALADANKSLSKDPKTDNGDRVLRMDHKEQK